MQQKMSKIFLATLCATHIFSYTLPTANSLPNVKIEAGEKIWVEHTTLPEGLIQQKATCGQKIKEIATDRGGTYVLGGLITAAVGSHLYSFNKDNKTAGLLGNCLGFMLENRLETAAGICGLSTLLYRLYKDCRTPQYIVVTKK